MIHRAPEIVHSGSADIMGVERMSITIVYNRGKRSFCSSRSHRGEQSIGMGDWKVQVSYSSTSQQPQPTWPTRFELAAALIISPPPNLEFANGATCQQLRLQRARIHIAARAGKGLARRFIRRHPEVGCHSSLLLLSTGIGYGSHASTKRPAGELGLRTAHVRVAGGRAESQGPAELA